MALKDIDDEQGAQLAMLFADAAMSISGQRNPGLESIREQAQGYLQQKALEKAKGKNKKGGFLKDLGRTAAKVGGNIVFPGLGDVLGAGVDEATGGSFKDSLLQSLSDPMNIASIGMGLSGGDSPDLSFDSADLGQQLTLGGEVPTTKAGSALTLKDPLANFEMEAVKAKPKFAGQLREAFKTGDLGEVGAILGGRVSSRPWAQEFGRGMGQEIQRGAISPGAQPGGPPGIKPTFGLTPQQVTTMQGQQNQQYESMQDRQLREKAMAQDRTQHLETLQQRADLFEKESKLREKLVKLGFDQDVAKRILEGELDFDEYVKKGEVQVENTKELEKTRHDLRMKEIQERGDQQVRSALTRRGSGGGGAAQPQGRRATPGQTVDITDDLFEKVTTGAFNPRTAIEAFNTGVVSEDTMFELAVQYAAQPGPIEDPHGVLTMLQLSGANEEQMSIMKRKLAEKAAGQQGQAQGPVGGGTHRVYDPGKGTFVQ